MFALSLFRQLAVFLAVVVAAACFSVPAFASDGADTGIALGESTVTVEQDRPQTKKKDGGSKFRVKMVRQDIRYNDDIVRVQDEEQDDSMQDKDIRNVSADLSEESAKKSYWCHEIQMEMVMEIIFDEEEAIEEQESGDMQDRDIDKGSSSAGSQAAGAETAPELETDQPSEKEESVKDGQEAAPSTEEDSGTATGNQDMAEPEKKQELEKESSDPPEKPPTENDAGQAGGSPPDSGGQDTPAADQE